MALKTWVKLPTAWIEEGGLKTFHWKQGEGSAGIAGLMVLMVLAHHGDDKDGTVRLTYDRLTAATGLSRTKVSHGLATLIQRGIVTRTPDQRSAYELVGYDPTQSWGKLPARPLYRDGQIEAFREFHLRRVTELDALKAYFAFVARRNRRTNVANISYPKIVEYAAIPRNRIKSAISLLAALNLVHVEHLPSQTSEYGVANAYRIVHVDSHHHMGTQGRHQLHEGGLDEHVDLPPGSRAIENVGDAPF